MKKLLLALTMVAALAGVAMASPRTNGGGTTDGSGDATNDNGDRGVTQIVDAAPEPDMVVRPVPEPGTMALASMGLIALGAAARKRREK